jgi:hypothetical protein
MEAEENEGMAFMLGLTPCPAPTTVVSTLPAGSTTSQRRRAPVQPCSPFISGTDLRIDGGLVANLFNQAVSHDRGDTRHRPIRYDPFDYLIDRTHTRCGSACEEQPWTGTRDGLRVGASKTWWLPRRPRSAPRTG